MSEIEDRPASLQRRRPKPAPDESIDPVDYQASAAASAAAVTSDPRIDERASAVTSPPLEPAAPMPPRRGRPRGRELTVPFSTRISQDVSELIDAISDDQGVTQRSVIEIAVREYWGGRAREGRRDL